ncbi:MAG: hypothetical protein H7223_00430 [Pedobacter sp.]|nr:hypothetical protein [Pedobacter sp.]
MPIERLKQSSNEELIPHIKSSLVGHEEEYVPGSWENFNKKDKKPSGLIFWIGGLCTAAAILLIGFSLFFYLENNTEVNSLNNDLVNNIPIITKPDHDTAKSKSLTESNSQSVPIHTIARSNVNINSAIASGRDLTIVSEESIIDNSSNAIKPIESGNDLVSQQHAILVTTADPPVTIPKRPITLDELLVNENDLKASEKDEAGKKLSVSKWDLGIVVAPSFGNTDRLNMGYGISMAYNLNSKLSLGSGMSYNEMGASKQITENKAQNSPSSNALVSDTKSLQSVNTRVSGIDIPIEVRYNLSNRFYANVGISAFAVIHQQQNNVYLQGTVVQRSAVNLAGDLQPQLFLVTKKVSESAQETLSTNSKLIGFYNFSLGYKQKISKDKSIGVEPFIKVPMKDVTKENLRLLGTGLKIKFDF